MDRRPDGMLVPVMICPATSPVVLLRCVTDADPLVSGPVKMVVGPVTVWPATSPVVLLIPVTKPIRSSVCR